MQPKAPLLWEVGLAHRSLGEGGGEVKIKNMNKNSTPLVDDHLQSLQGMKEAGTDDFFYTRLKAKMLARQTRKESDPSRQGWSFTLKPAWVVGSLVLLLALNGFMLFQKFRSGKVKTAASVTLQSFAESYDQTITSSY